MTRYVTPLLARADMTSACAYLDSDITKLSEAVKDLQRVGERPTLADKAFLTRQRNRLTQIIENMETEHAAA